MLDLSVRMKALTTKWDSCKAQDDAKQSLIEELFEHVKGVSKKLAEAEAELLDKNKMVKMSLALIEHNRKQLEALQSEKARNHFVFVIIDGDNIPFIDALVKDGLDGGRKASSLLVQAIEQDMMRILPNAMGHSRVLIRVYAGIEGLARTYDSIANMPDGAFLDFVRGFNDSHRLSDYIDAGRGKECADNKVRANFELYMDDTHCQHVYFCGSGDNGYARMLSPYIERQEQHSRFTVIEGIPFARELNEMKGKLRTLALPDILRSQKLVSNKGKPVSRQADSATRLPWSPQVDSHPRSPVSDAQVQASPPSRGQKILRNKNGDRLDPKIKHSPGEVLQLKRRKLCNSFHLLGHCPHVRKFGNCSHAHGTVTLRPEQLQALRVVARQSPCHQGLKCDDPDCFQGHQCAREKCPGVGEGCRFPQDMHNVDTWCATAV